MHIPNTQSIKCIQVAFWGEKVKGKKLKTDVSPLGVEQGLNINVKSEGAQKRCALGQSELRHNTFLHIKPFTPLTRASLTSVMWECYEFIWMGLCCFVFTFALLRLAPQVISNINTLTIADFTA